MAGEAIVSCRDASFQRNLTHFVANFENVFFILLVSLDLMQFMLGPSNYICLDFDPCSPLKFFFAGQPGQERRGTNTFFSVAAATVWEKQVSLS